VRCMAGYGYLQLSLGGPPVLLTQLTASATDPDSDCS